MPIPLHTGYDAARLRQAASGSKNAGQTRRVLALAAIDDGASRAEAAAVGGVTLQIVRDWVLKLNAGGPEGLVDYKGSGPQPILTDAHRAVLAQAIEDGPIPVIHGVVRGRLVGDDSSRIRVMPCVRASVQRLGELVVFVVRRWPNGISWR